MTIKEKLQDEIVIIALRGTLLGEPHASNLRQTVYRLLGEERKKFVFDLGDLKFINSMGLGSFIAALTSIRKRGGDMCLARVRGKVEAVIMITQLVKVFRLYATVEKAIESFKE